MLDFEESSVKTESDNFYDVIDNHLVSFIRSEKYIQNIIVFGLCINGE
jgi:hypothetical protein